MNDDMSNFI